MPSERSSVPVWLETPPVILQIAPPVRTTAQVLPFNELGWENFEKLCLRLARTVGDVEHTQLYGTRGQAQEGIDFYVRPHLGDRYRVYQCKRYRRLTAAIIRSAADAFLKGEWAERSETFYLCATDSFTNRRLAKAIEDAATRLRERGVALIPQGPDELSQELREHPEIVHDFFGPPWVREFLGEDIANSFKNRLSPQEVQKYRSDLRDFCKVMFEIQDPGVDVGLRWSHQETPALIPQPVPLEKRFVVPDVEEIWTQSDPGEPDRNADDGQSPPSPTLNVPDFIVNGAQGSPASQAVFKFGRSSAVSRPRRESFTRRVSAPNWLAQKENCVILGVPGSGKSTLARFVTLDLLSDDPTLPVLAAKWGLHLPLWLPFAFWCAQVAREDGEVVSLTDGIQRWLRTWDRSHLWGLVEKAMTDDRLLLVVDGLDEWSDEDAAQRALDRLCMFIEEQNVPILAFSRPHGYRRLRLAGQSWSQGSLAGLSVAQQEELAGHSFRQRHIALRTPPGSIAEFVHQDTSAFMAQMAEIPDLRELAAVPLLLLLMTLFHQHNFPLPQSRFRAYAKIVEHLVAIHPSSRSRAAQIQSEPIGLSGEDLLHAYSRLAAEIHLNHPGGAIQREGARRAICDYLQDDQYGLGYSRPDAMRLAEELVPYGEGTIGILVPKSPQEVGFYHRAFQEYMTARWLSSRPLKEQLETVVDRYPDPTWREVILGLFQISGRPSDVDTLVHEIDQQPTNTIGRLAREELLAEASFGDFGLSPRSARTLAGRTYQLIEADDTWMPHRTRLLGHVIPGLRQGPLRADVQGNINRWFPQRTRYRGGLYRTIGQNWPATAETAAILFRGLFDEGFGSREAAAAAIVERFAGDEQVGSDLVRLVRSAQEEDVLAHAAFARFDGWPPDSDMDELVSACLANPSPSVRVAGYFGRIKQGEQGIADRDALLDLAQSGAASYSNWRDWVNACLIQGWPGDTTVRDVFLRFDSGGSRMDRNSAWWLLLDGFVGDEYIAQKIVRELREDHHPFLELDFVYDLSDSLRLWIDQIPEVAAAFEEFLSRHTRDDFLRYRYAKLAALRPTGHAKTVLIEQLSDKYRFHAARGLLDGWGMEDGEVSAALEQLAWGEPGPASTIAHLMPRIVDDRTHCHTRLVELLTSKQTERLDFVVEGLLALVPEPGDSEIPELILGMSLDPERLDNETIHGKLISGYPWHPAVRELAWSSLHDARRNHLETIAQAYAEDAEMRDAVAQMVSSLPNTLRLAIADRLPDSGDRQFGMQTLGRYHLETNEEIATAASINYHRLVRSTGTDVQPALDRIAKEIQAVGPDFDDRRQAALAGLVEIDRLDTLREIPELWDSNGKMAGLGIRIDLNVSFMKYIISRWPQVQSAFEGKISNQLLDITNVYNLDAIAPLVEVKHPLHAEIMSVLETQRPEHTSGNLLKFLAVERPKSRLLLDYCLGTANVRSEQRPSGPVYFETPQSIATSLDLIEEHFANDPDILQELDQKYRPFSNRFDMLAVLVAGWPQSSQTQRIIQETQDQSKPFIVYARTTAKLGESKKIEEWLSQELNAPSDFHSFHWQVCAEQIVKRLRTDQELARLFEERIFSTPSGLVKTSYPKLLSTAGQLTSSLRAWCTEELERQVNSPGVQEFGVDITRGEIVSVARAQLEILWHAQ